MIRVNSLIDSGARVSVIRSDVAHEIGAIRNEPFNLEHSDGLVEKTVIVGCRILYKNRFLDLYPAISSRIKEPLIIGVDFLQMYHGYLDMGKEKISFNKFAPRFRGKTARI